MNILYVTTVGLTMNFFENFIKELIDEGNRVDIATNGKEFPVADCYIEWGCRLYQIDTVRSPLNISNLKAIQQIKRIVQKYDIVHCHTPVAAVCVRFACRKVRNRGTKIYYTAHGFHFYKGAPLKNWLLYYPIEWICAHWTDVLITINREDYVLAKKRMHAGQVVYIPGVGIDLKKMNDVKVDVDSVREKFGIPKSAKILLSVGELNKNKNHKTVIKAIADMDIYYVIAGSGNLKVPLQNLILKLKISDKVKLVGQRNDIIELCKAADFFICPSFREGLPVAVMEAMACGLPVVCSRIRGNRDLIDENGGIFFNPHSVRDCNSAISKLLDSDFLGMGTYNKEKVSRYSIERINKKMKEIL